MDIARKASALYSRGDNESLFRLAQESWPGIDKKLPKGIGEACRFTSIRARQMGRLADHHLWRARTVTTAVMTRSRVTGAGLLLPHYFAAIAIAVEESEGREVQVYEDARSILEEMKRLVPVGTSAWSRLFARLYHEKLALSYLMEGTGGRRPLRGCQKKLKTAKTEYSRALKVAKGERDVLKVRGGLALVDYLLLAYDNPSSLRDERMALCLTETREVGSADYPDVKVWATTNAKAMRLGKFVGWTPYEVL